MTAHSLEYAPGCFGSAMSFDEEARECRVCVFGEQCKPQAEARREALNVKFGVRVGGSKETRPNEAIPIRVGTLLARIRAMNIDVAGAFKARRNPFLVQRHGKIATYSGMRHLAATAQILIVATKGVDRLTIRALLQKKFEWAEGTAAAFTLQSVQVFQQLDVIEEIHGCVKLKD